MNPKLTDWFDKYLLGQMNETEQKEFLAALASDDNLKKSFDDYQLLIQSFTDYHYKNHLEQKMNEWYLDEYSSIAKNNRKAWWKVASVAASVAILVTLAGIWLYENLIKETKKQSNEIVYLKKELKQIQSQQNKLVRNIKKIEEKNYAPANSQSTAFLFAPNYLLTTFHSIQNADSLFVESDNFPRSFGRVVYTNADLDVAVLYVPELKIKPPFSFFKTDGDFGQRVYTLGFPTNQLVYNEGYISALNGYNNDTAFYQITMSLNPGNSGAPLFNNNGQIIGMIVSKNINMEGVAFAIKSDMLFTLKDSLPADSVKQVWSKAFRNISGKLPVREQIPFIFKVYVYQKSI